MTALAGPTYLIRGSRLMALLLSVLLSVSVPTVLAASDSCAVDCSAAQVEMLDHADSECGTCSAMTAAPLFIPAYPDSLAGISSPAVVEFIAPPPREPPRA